MKQFTWFVLTIKAIGVLLIGMSLSSLLYPLQWIGMFFDDQTGAYGGVGRIIAYFIVSLGPLAQFVFGLYLLLGGRRIISRCIRMVDGHCIVCGYDVRGLDAKVCPECGTGLGDMGDDSGEDGAGHGAGGSTS